LYSNAVNTRRLAGALLQPVRLLHRSADDLAQPLVAGQTEEVIHAVLLAPGHQFFAAEAGVGPQHDLHFRPTLSQLRHDTADLCHRTCRCILVGCPEPRAQ